MEIIAFALRMAAPLIAGLLVILCYVSLHSGRREEKALIVLQDEQHDLVYPVLYWENSIGRSRSSDVHLEDPTVSRDHAVLLRREAGWLITDTGSRSGVLVNGQPTQGRTPVGVGDKITLGSTHLVLRRTSDISGQSAQRSTLRYISAAVLEALLLLYLSMITVSAALTTGSNTPGLMGGIFCAVTVVFCFVSVKLLHRHSFEQETLALLITGTGIILSSVHNERQCMVQLIAAGIGICFFCFMLWFLEVPDRVVKWHLIISILSLLLLAAALIFGKVQNGAKNWISLGPVSVQPSEFVKICYVFVGASTLDVLQTKKNLTEFIIVSALTVGLLAYMSDFGTALIFFCTFLIIAFMRSGDIRTVILALTGAGLGALMILSVKPYIADRFAAWGHVWEYADSSGYQQVHSLIYSASGGLFGVGYSEGYLQYLFASENDLVFCLLCEEAGCLLALICAVIIGGFVLYARGAATRSRSTFYSISACAAGGLLVIQTALNVFGVVDILPLTGVTFPFLSYGGSSMVACWGLLAFMKAADERTYSHYKRLKKTKPEEAPAAAA